MDLDTLMLMGLLVGAFSWWLAIHVKETRAFLKQCKVDQVDKLKRDERVRRLTDKL